MSKVINNTTQARIVRMSNLKDLELELCRDVASSLNYMEQRLLIHEEAILETEDVTNGNAIGSETKAEIDPIYLAKSINDDLKQVVGTLQVFIQQAKLVQKKQLSNQL